MSVVRVSVQGPVPWQAPLHPWKVDPAGGVAVRVTTVPAGYLYRQSGPQVIPSGLLLTSPIPPLLLTVS